MKCHMFSKVKYEVPQVKHEVTDADKFGQPIYYTLMFIKYLS